MKIAAIETAHLLYRYDKPFTYGGGVCTGRLASLVFVHTDDGRTGIGSVYSHPGMVELVVKRQLEPLLIGRDAADIDGLWKMMYGLTRWYGRKGAAMSAIGGIDTALWDLRGKAAGLPVRKLLSRDAKDLCPAYASGLLWKEIAALETEAAGHIAAGFRRVKMRVGQSDEYDAAAMRAVRKAIGPKNDMMVDAVMRYDVATARRMAPVLREVRAFWFEEPFQPEDIDSFLALRGHIDVRVSTGENEFGVQGFREWIRAKAVDIVQPDVCRCGGISEAWRVGQMALEAGLEVAPHTWSDAVTMIANAHVVAALPNGITVEVDRTGNPLIERLLVEPPVVRDGVIKLSDAPGLGIEVDMKLVEKLRMPDPFSIPDGNYSDFAFGKAHFRG
ncbi:MAG: mandelate racemase/muconate lactonizing enzyme family protein [Planctomycetes bacterium]|nr:mandelate racemase/muconate lactonizing enzyme family protein [Planctomycetota bacterium]